MSSRFRVIVRRIIRLPKFNFEKYYNITLVKFKTDVSYPTTY